MVHGTSRSRSRSLALAPATKLAAADLSLELSKADYKARSDALKDRLREMQLAYKFANRRAVILIEGWDAAGKGGVIRRLTGPLDPRGYQVWPIGAPSEQERGEHYLQRFWRKLPEAGVISVFDRSWYGRVLVERVEGFSKPADWKRGYGEINAFEKMLTDDGVRIVKLFLHVSRPMQRARMALRMSDPLESWKMSPSDVRNVELRPQYEQAVDEMIARCSPKSAPWFVVPFEQKQYGRIAALETVLDRLGPGLDTAAPPISDDLLASAAAAGIWPAGAKGGKPSANAKSGHKSAAKRR